MQYHEKLVSNKSLVCTRRVLRIHIFSALLETEGLEACDGRKLHKENFQSVRTSKRLKKKKKDKFQDTGNSVEHFYCKNTETRTLAGL